MTSPLAGLPGTSIASAVAQNSGAAKAGKSLDQDAFLKLLVAQLKYQDPSKPSDATQFLTQTAQFTQVEKLSQIADSQASLLTSQRLLGASNLIGREVTYIGANGADVTGVVVSATFGGSDPSIKVGDRDVPLSSVKEVRRSA
ncbi:MAG TPA: flagellar hook capping FlgD N-terminal domain-containing protein [Catenuloplanes sp.]|jgi:flagellar basal-body rod modification protein FlgD